MNIIAKCPKCFSSSRLDITSADKRVRCRKCGRLFKLPTLAELQKPIEVIKNAGATVYVDEKGNIYA